MPKIKLSNPFVTGQETLLQQGVFSDPRDRYTRNIYANEAFVSAVDENVVDDGLMSHANGKLDIHNLGSSDLKISAEHIMPEQAALGRMDSLSASATIYSNGIGFKNNASADNWVTLPGVSLRWYQPYATTLTLMHWDMFLSFNNWRFNGLDLNNTYSLFGRHTQVKFRCLLDGEYISNSSRRVGENFFHPVAPGYTDSKDAVGPGLDSYDGEYVSAIEKVEGGNPKYVWPEAHSATPVSWHYPKALSKGFHEISVQVLTDRMSGDAVYVQNIGTDARDGDVNGRGYFELVTKISLGIRNARIISFL